MSHRPQRAQAEEESGELYDDGQLVLVSHYEQDERACIWNAEAIVLSCGSQREVRTSYKLLANPFERTFRHEVLVRRHYQAKEQDELQKDANKHLFARELMMRTPSFVRRRRRWTVLLYHFLFLFQVKEVLIFYLFALS